jgi:serine/threonine protein phosphatase PrpC
MTMDPALDLPAVEYAERSDPGRDPSKQINEDACGRRETVLGHLCVVCDGMGGHAAGREAAELALATIFETFAEAPAGAAPAAVLRAAVEEASRRVYSMPASEVALGRPGSTMVAVLLHAQGTEVVHVGDSRAYLVHEGQIFRVTRDHSVVQEMVDHGLITQDQAPHHPDANRITRALGMAPEIEADVRAVPVQHVTGDTFILCSDGLSDLVGDPEILEAVGGVPAAQAVGKLVDLANARGGHDNITVLVLRARSSCLVPSAGVAPTIAQTGVTQPAPPSRPPPTFVERPLDAIESVRPVPESARRVSDRATATPFAKPLEPTIPPGPRPAWRLGPFGPVVVAGFAIAGLAVALLAVVLASHMAERSGTHNAGPSDPALAFPEGGRAPPTALVPVRPSSEGSETADVASDADVPRVPAVPAPPATLAPQALPPLPAPDETLAPLEPAPSADPPHRRKPKH